MENLYPTIRNTVRAVIIKNGRILLQKKLDDHQDIRYTLPGGEQETGETTLEEALQRECLEEIATRVLPDKVVHISDFFKRKQLPEPHPRHQLEILFRCRVPDSYVSQNDSKPDKHQIAIEWVAIEELSQHKLSPDFLSEVLPKQAAD